MFDPAALLSTAMAPPDTLPFEGLPPPKYVENTRLLAPVLVGATLLMKNAFEPCNVDWKVPAVGASGKLVEFVMPITYTKSLSSSVMPLALSVWLPEK